MFPSALPSSLLKLVIVKQLISFPGPLHGFWAGASPEAKEEVLPSNEPRKLLIIIETVLYKTSTRIHELTIPFPAVFPHLFRHLKLFGPKTLYVIQWYKICATTRKRSLDCLAPVFARPNWRANCLQVQFKLAKKGTFLVINPTQFFACRCGVEPSNDKISYKEFLRRFQDRSEQGMPHKILANPLHRYGMDWTHLFFN